MTHSTPRTPVQTHTAFTAHLDGKPLTVTVGVELDVFGRTSRPHGHDGPPGDHFEFSPVVFVSIVVRHGDEELSSAGLTTLRSSFDAVELPEWATRAVASHLARQVALHRLPEGFTAAIAVSAIDLARGLLVSSIANPVSVPPSYLRDLLERFERDHEEQHAVEAARQAVRHRED